MDALSLLKIIITAPFGIVYFLLLSNWRFSKTKTFLITGAGILGVIILDILMELRLPYGLSDLEFRLLHIIIAAGFVIILSRYNDARTFFPFFCHVPLWRSRTCSAVSWHLICQMALESF